MPVHPVVVDPRIPVVVGVDDPVSWRAGRAFPADLELLWSSAKPLKSAKGVNPTYTDTPILSAGGVVPGDGPTFTDVITWSDGGTLVVEFTATTASAALVGDVQVFGPLYANSSGLLAKDGTNAATCATSWGVGDVVTGVVKISDGYMLLESR